MCKFHGKTPFLESLFSKVAGLKTGSFTKKRIQHICFPVKFVKFSRTLFFTEHLRWLLLVTFYCPFFEIKSLYATLFENNAFTWKENWLFLRVSLGCYFHLCNSIPTLPCLIVGGGRGVGGARVLITGVGWWNLSKWRGGLF